MMSIFFGAEFVGYLTPIPYTVVATQTKKYTTAQPMYYIIFGGVFILFAVIEIFAFYYMPSKLGIKIDYRQEE